MTVAMLEELRVGLWAQHLQQENPSCGFMELTGALFVRNPEIASRLWGFPIGTLAEGAAADVILVDYHAADPAERLDRPRASRLRHLAGDRRHDDLRRPGPDGRTEARDRPRRGRPRGGEPSARHGALGAVLNEPGAIHDATGAARGRAENEEAHVTRTAVIAIGGNSLITDKEHQTVPDQYLAAAETCRHVAPLLADGDLRLVITHGNGPQVGFILRRSELAAEGAPHGASRLLRGGHAGGDRLPHPARPPQRVPQARASRRARPPSSRSASSTGRTPPSRSRTSRSARSSRRSRPTTTARRTAGTSSRTRGAAGGASSPRPPRRRSSSSPR